MKFLFFSVVVGLACARNIFCCCCCCVDRTFPNLVLLSVVPPPYIGPILKSKKKIQSIILTLSLNDNLTVASFGLAKKWTSATPPTINLVQKNPTQNLSIIYLGRYMTNRHTCPPPVVYNSPVKCIPVISELVTSSNIYNYMILFHLDLMQQ